MFRYSCCTCLLQGALYGVKSLAVGTAPLLCAGLFAGFTRTDSPLPFFPGDR